jgi:hypothetical protein
MSVGNFTDVVVSWGLKISVSIEPSRTSWDGVPSIWDLAITVDKPGMYESSLSLTRTGKIDEIEKYLEKALPAVGALIGDHN